MFEEIINKGFTVGKGKECIKALKHARPEPRWYVLLPDQKVQAQESP